MAGITIPKRAQACYHLMTHDFDIDRTVDHIVEAFADEPAMQRANNPRKLARNIVTIGGSGDQQEMNLQAFKVALDWLDQDRRRNREIEHQREIADLNAKLERESQRAAAAETDFRRVSMQALNPGTRAPVPEDESAPVSS